MQLMQHLTMLLQCQVLAVLREVGERHGHILEVTRVAQIFSGVAQAIANSPPMTPGGTELVWVRSPVASLAIT